MTKVRYFKFRMRTVSTIEDIGYPGTWNNGAISVLTFSKNEMVATFRIMREIFTVQYLPDGSIIPGVASTMEQHQIRIFCRNSQLYIALIDPPRGAKVISDFLTYISMGREFFIESLEISRELIEGHIIKFESAKLISAKIKDFHIYDKAVARLEVTSKEGLRSDIAPILEGKFHRTESLTYEVMHKFRKGLITYLANGTVRISALLVEYGLPSFEQQLK
ncbi:MAG: hypothetical protein H7240_06935 [Glaciimonas sp.]|nr:hypothetical protein [Glaciimonas sp.]